MSYWAGLLEGFSGRRNEAATRSYEQDTARRASEGKIYEYLLESRDPDIKALALSGLMESAQPGTKKRGMGGFLGEMEGSQIYPQIRALMQQEVPDTTGAPPAQPGSAAMPSTSLVDPGSAPPNFASTQAGDFRQGTEGGFTSPRAASQVGAAFGEPAADEAPPAAPPMLQGRSMTGIPMRPPESKWKRRGTGVPTAEEIAESSAEGQLKGRLTALMEGLRSARTPQEERLVMGAGGAPPALDTTANGPLMADPNDPETPIPTVRHRDGTVTTVEGAPVQGLVGYVKPTTSGRVTKTMEDRTSPTGYMSVTYDPTGQELFRVPTEYAPPPAYAGTTTLVTPEGGREVVPINRGGGIGPALGPAPPPAGQPSGGEADAKAFLEVVTRAIAQAENATSPVSSMRKKLTPQQIDTLVRQQAQAQGLPYTSYYEVQRAAQGTTTGGTATPAGESAADRVRQRLLQGQSTPPARPSARSTGPAPVRPPRP